MLDFNGLAALWIAGAAMGAIYGGIVALTQIVSTRKRKKRKGDPAEDQFRASLERANAEVAKEWTHCRKCKKPIRREFAQVHDEMCDVCFAKSKPRHR
jgi:predicted acylesterase/phospholipase RssA